MKLRVSQTGYALNYDCGRLSLPGCGCARCGRRRVAELLRECPDLKFLVTSREALHVRGEYILPVSPLALPDTGRERLSVEQLMRYEAVQLFVDRRAQAVKPDFKVTDENAPVIADICARVDGLPLAIELAAARIRLFSPQALLGRLESRLTMLRGGARDLPARQQALRDTIEWSFELLDSGEQRLFELLSVFSGGSSFEAVEEIVSRVEYPGMSGADMLDKLASLVDKSLIPVWLRDKGSHLDFTRIAL